MRAHLQDMVDARPNGRPQLEELECASSAMRRFGRLVNKVGCERRKALRAWCDYNKAANPNSRNELSASQKVKD